MKYRRITLKLSGEAFSSSRDELLSAGVVRELAEQIGVLTAEDIKIAIVPGGGNVFRGRDLREDARSIGVSHITADQIGMLATFMNALVLRDALANMDVPSTIYSPHAIKGVSIGYSVHEARRAYLKGEVILCPGGTGNPMFTTDTAAGMRAIELGADVLLKATNVDGVYESDPRKNANAQRFDELSFDEVIRRDLKVMDLAAFTLCREHDMPILVYNLGTQDALTKIVKGENVGTLIRNSTRDRTQ